MLAIPLCCCEIGQNIDTDLLRFPLLLCLLLLLRLVLCLLLRLGLWRLLRLRLCLLWSLSLLLLLLLLLLGWRSWCGSWRLHIPGSAAKH